MYVDVLSNETNAYSKGVLLKTQLPSSVDYYLVILNSTKLFVGTLRRNTFYLTA